MQAAMTVNQVHPPRPKRVRVDAQGNDKRRLWLKDGHSTMLFYEGLTENGCKSLINAVNTALIRMNKKALPNNRFLITR